MAGKKNCSGGHRDNAGRPQTGRVFPLSVKISAEAKDVLDRQSNKAEYIDELLKAQR